MSRLGWIKRRARRLQRVFRITRRLAVLSAHEDFLSFHGRSA